ncbi:MULTISPECIES: PA1571 family protein [unclassified Pantoea]|uniref:PA1571 family protein n=1 Tax=unclassified Pantoea TaxID=2630326 RepID=UPI0014208565|nr:MULTISPECIES: PA1571 family protein [unclassified Pantoea]
MSLQHNSDSVKPQNKTQPKACGSIIDAQGREVEITEQMIQQACKALEESRVEKVRKG